MVLGEEELGTGGGGAWKWRSPELEEGGCTDGCIVLIAILRIGAGAGAYVRYTARDGRGGGAGGAAAAADGAGAGDAAAAAADGAGGGLGLSLGCGGLGLSRVLGLSPDFGAIPKRRKRSFSVSRKEHVRLRQPRLSQNLGLKLKTP